ncbi:MAG: hypothetical protein ACRDBP_11425 [Luteolibacter sp.]
MAQLTAMVVGGTAKQPDLIHGTWDETAQARQLARIGKGWRLSALRLKNLKKDNALLHPIFVPVILALHGTTGFAGWFERDRVSEGILQDPF